MGGGEFRLGFWITAGLHVANAFAVCQTLPPLIIHGRNDGRTKRRTLSASRSSLFFDAPSKRDI